MVTDNEIGRAEDCDQEGSADCSPTTSTAVPGDAERYARAVQGSPSYGDLGRVTGAHSKLGVGDPGPAIIPRLSSCTDDSNVEDHSGEESGGKQGSPSYGDLGRVTVLTPSWEWVIQAWP